ncbi:MULTISPECIES: oligosaccharide biosynthesis protein Alg14 [Stenotrophomonas]|uniref:oligosaccharide biosynthesis protein Alg14 n=1 Tax=Stenotrophomonas TaxID=40323 RepID=UPI000D0BDF09|nr:oligosaccharide biosynthesis protein Alg14 [Stenotrophomonas maltophilia]
MRKKIVAAASFGGHWIQLLRLKKLLDQHTTTYVSTNRELGEFIPDNNFYCVRDSAAENKLGLLITFTQALFIIIKVRPDIVISTGAAPGLAFVFWGRIFGAKTIWLDSVANAEEMSRSGRIAKRYSSLWLSQWPDVAEVHGASYLGRVI